MSSRRGRERARQCGACPVVRRTAPRSAARRARRVGSAGPGLAAYLAPEPERREARRRRASRASSSPRPARWALLRWPYLLAFATLACLPARIPVTLGDEDATCCSRCTPSSARSRWCSRGSSSCGATCACASSARLRSRSPRSSAGPASRSRGATTCTRARSCSAPSSCRSGCWRSASRGSPGAAAGSPGCGRCSSAWPSLYAGDRDLPVGHARPLLEPEGDHRQRVRTVLPGQLGLLGSRRSTAAILVVGILARSRASCSAASRSRKLAGLVAVVVADVGRAASSRSRSRASPLCPSGSRSRPPRRLALARRALARRRGARRSAVGARRAAPRATRSSRQSRTGLDTRHERSLGRSSGRACGSRSTIPARGVGAGGFKRAYAERTGLQGKRAEEGRVAHDAGHGRGRDGLPGPRCSSAGCSSPRSLAAFRRARPRLHVARRRSPLGLRSCAITVHSLFYNAFFEDPMTWALLGPRRRCAVQRAAGKGAGERGTPAADRGRGRRALVLAPHTDDGEFGCGGTMARLVEAGCEVRYVAFSIATRRCRRASRRTRWRARCARRPPSSASRRRT